MLQIPTQVISVLLRLVAKTCHNLFEARFMGCRASMELRSTVHLNPNVRKRTSCLRKAASSRLAAQTDPVNIPPSPELPPIARSRQPGATK